MNGTLHHGEQLRKLVDVGLTYTVTESVPARHWRLVGNAACSDSSPVPDSSIDLATATASMNDLEVVTCTFVTAPIQRISL